MDSYIEILEKRFADCGINKYDILKSIKIMDENCTVIIYTSHLENLGNKNSDFDIYVLSDKYPINVDDNECDNCIIALGKVNKAVIDIEYWTFDKLNGLYNEKNYFYDKNKLKLLKRLAVGVILYGEALGNRIKNRLAGLDLDDTIANYFISMANRENDDAIKMFKATEYTCSLLCARRALDYAIGAYNAKNGMAILNEKWIPKIIKDNNGFGNPELCDQYLYYNIYASVNNEDIKLFTEKLIDFISTLLMRIALI